MDDWGSIPASGSDSIFSLCHHCVQTSSKAHPASYTKGTGRPLRSVKGPGHEADHLPPINFRVKNAWSQYFFVVWLN
jgi:hypothetical protein